MSEEWFSQGYEEAEKMSQQTKKLRRRQRNFWTRSGERATIRFLKPIKDSFNYKRAYVKYAQGQKFYTSPGEQPDPFVESGLNLQSAFAWPIIDRRVLEFEVEGEKGTEVKNIGPRISFFADGPKTRTALIAFENEMRAQINEEREAEGLKPLTPEEYNITHFDVRVVKEKGAPWQFFAVRGGQPTELSSEDQKLAEENQINLQEELKPLPIEEIKAVLNNKLNIQAEEETRTPYAYGEDTEQAEEPSFFNHD